MSESLGGSMNHITLFLIAVSLSMDAFSVAICKGLGLREVKLDKALLVGFYFGAFQGIMPVLGYFVGSSFAKTIQAWDHWIAFGLLSILGCNMIKEAREKNSCPVADFSPREMIPLAIATSIDALIIGVSFAMLQVNIYESASFIALCTFLFSFAGVYIGHRFGQKFEDKAQILGGIMLIGIGVKVLVDHLNLLSYLPFFS